MVGVTYFGVSKAFDMVDNVLLTKLATVGFMPQLLHFMKAICEIVGNM